MKRRSTVFRRSRVSAEERASIAAFRVNRMRAFAAAQDFANCLVNGLRIAGPSEEQ